MKRAIGFAILVLACPAAEPPKLQFRPFESPSGVPDPQTVKDEAIDQPGRVGIETTLVVPASIEWDQLRRLLDSIGRQARGRSGFKNAGRPQFADVRVYGDAAKATDPEAWIGRMHFEGSEAPAIELRIPFPLEKTMQKMIVEMPEYGQIKPKAKAVDAEGKLELTVPYVSLGEDTYRKKIDFGTAIQEFNTWVLKLFRKYDALKDFTFIGEWQGKEMVKIRMTREQYDAVNVAKVEEDLGAFSGEFLVGQMQGVISDEAVAKKLLKKRREVYGAELRQLPPEQVSIDRSLK